MGITDALSRASLLGKPQGSLLERRLKEEQGVTNKTKATV